MPNTPMLVQQGASAYCLGRWATQVRLGGPCCSRTNAAHRAHALLGALSGATSP
jgi:hypothetical protein